MKVGIGIIACRKYWYTGCPGLNSHVLCFDALREKKGPLGEIPGARFVSYRPCPGCPGEGLKETARLMLAEDGVNVIAFGSCCFLLENCAAVGQVAGEITATTGCPVVLGSYLKPHKRLHSLPHHYFHELYEHRCAALRFLNLCSWISATRTETNPGLDNPFSPELSPDLWSQRP